MREDDVAARGLEPGHQRGGLAEVAAEPDRADARVLAGQLGEHLPGAVAAAVVDEDELGRPVRAVREHRRRARRASAARLSSSLWTGTTTLIG